MTENNYIISCFIVYKGGYVYIPLYFHKISRLDHMVSVFNKSKHRLLTVISWSLLPMVPYKNNFIEAYTLAQFVQLVLQHVSLYMELSEHLIMTGVVSFINKLPVRSCTTMKRVSDKTFQFKYYLYVYCCAKKICSFLLLSYFFQYIHAFILMQSQNFDPTLLSLGATCCGQMN